jgi:NAD(P)H-flavin reductase
MMNYDPDVCYVCGQPGRVVDSRRAFGYRRRRHQCVTGCCETDGARRGQPRRWTTYQSRVDVRRTIRKWLKEATT